MSAKPNQNRDYFLARIARALGVAGYSTEECDAIMVWAQEIERPSAGGRRCGACNGSGQRPAVREMTLSAAESMDGMSEQTAFLIQGICLACRGQGALS